MAAEAKKTISPIAIDMGAKNTGVYLNHFEPGEDPTTSGNIQGKTIVIDSANITWSQADRTQKRHQIRTIKRAKLAKRLLKLILTDKEAYKLNNITQKQLEFLMGLLNHRGYNRIETTPEQEETLKLKIVSDFFFPIIFDRETNNSNLLEELEKLDSEIIPGDKNSEKQWEEVLKNKVFSLSGKNNSEFKEYAKKKGNEKEDIEELSKAFTAIKNLIQTQRDNYKSGHLHRKKYLKNIEDDIKKSALLKPLLGKELTAEKLAYLIGNISNLQLRVLRKYFNDENMKSGDKWLPEKLHDLFFKWVRSWHAKQENEKEHRKQLLALKDKNINILEIFSTSNPELTIPPYEDQNNRRPPKDLTLRLKPKSLDKYLPCWKDIAHSLADNYILPPIKESITESVNIQEGLEDNVRPQKIKDINQDTAERQILADTLHRILDRSIVLDPYKLRWLAQDSDTPEARKAKDLLNNHSDNQADYIIALAKKYYEEVDTAKQGLWTNSENSLFFRCDTNPPHKSTITHKLVGHILRERFTEERVKDFRENCWNQKIKGNSTTKSIAKKIEETRKEYGNSFNYIAQTIKRRQYILANKGPTQEQKDGWNKYEKYYGDVVEAIENAGQVAKKISNFLQHGKEDKYNNPYSIAQLYNHLEAESSGFSKTDKWNTEENAWRDKEQTVQILDKTGEKIKVTRSNAVRLTADSIRPFDGMLDRIISRQAIEIARMKIAQIEALRIDKNEFLFVPIFMEQNNFAFEQSLHEIKGLNNVKKKTKDKVRKGLEKQETQWQDKDNRIKKNTYCPYTDEFITNGEIDHIIPQSQSKKRGDVVFNSEANLIYCSGNGNHQKDSNRWEFNQLKDKYLKEVFGNSNTEQLKQEIKDFVNGLDENDPISFHNLDEREQNYLRHALFIPTLDNKTFPLLNTRYKTLVNGTQGYLGKQIRKLLQDKYPKIQVKTYQIKAQDVSQLRDDLGNFDNDLAKKIDNPELNGFWGKLSKESKLNIKTLKENLLHGTKIISKDEFNKKIKEKKNEQLSKIKDSALLEKYFDSKIKISKPQGAFSHVIDASLVLAAALQYPKISEELTTTNTTELTEQGKWLKDLLPENGQVQHIKRKPKYRKKLSSTQIFKEGLYGERFMPILLNDKKLYYGFSLDDNNRKEIVVNKKQGFETLDAYFDLLKPFLYTGSTRKKNKKPVTGDLSDNWKYAYLSIDKTKALEHLQKCAKENCSNEEIKQAKELEKLRYSVEKKKVEDFLLTGQNKKTFIEKLDNRKFKVKPNLTLPAKTQWEALIKHSITDYRGNKTTLNECFGKAAQIEIANPKMVNFWRDLAQKELDIDYLQQHLLKRNDKGEIAKKCAIIPKGVFDKKIKTEKRLKALEDNALLKESFGMEFKIMTDLIPQEAWKELFEKFFHTKKIKNPNKHKRVRKDYSLPVVSAPSGGFRIKRKNPLTKEVVYQVSGVEGFSTKGFDKTLKTPVLIDELKDSPNIASLDGKQVEVDNVYYFDKWRKIKLPEELAKKITSLSYAIGTQDRFYIRVSMSFNKFKELDSTIKHFANIPPELKEPKKNDFLKYFMINNPELNDIKNHRLWRKLITENKKGKKVVVNKTKYKEIVKDDKKLLNLNLSGKYLKITLLGEPRSNLDVEFVSKDTITFSYTVNDTNQEMKKAYQDGTSIK